MAFDVYGTRGALGWNLEKLNELQVYLAEDELDTGYRTVYGGDRFPYHGHFVPGSANGIGFEDLVVIEDFEFCRAVAEERPHRPGFAEALEWVSVQAALLRVRAERALGARRLAAGGLSAMDQRREPAATAAPPGRGIGVIGGPDRAHARGPARAPGAGRDGRRRPRRARPTARGVGAELGVPGGAVRPGAADRPDVDAVAICTSTDTHADLIVAAAEAGKAIFCEKPVSLDLAEVDRALQAVDEAGVPFQIGFNRRFDPAHQSVRDAVAAGAVGEPHLVRITSRDPAPPPMEYVRHSGGIFLDMTIHDFDMARYVTGSEVVEVFARGAVRVDPAFAEAGDVDTAVIVSSTRTAA